MKKCSITIQLHQNPESWSFCYNLALKQIFLQFLSLLQMSVDLYIDFCYTWIPSLAHVHPKSILLDLAKHCFSIIWRSSKKMNFPKIWRLWLKNCARHVHLNFELLKGVAASFFELYPSNFSQACIFYRQTNDVFTAKLYL